jgi:hypothetical protein
MLLFKTKKNAFICGKKCYKNIGKIANNELKFFKENIDGFSCPEGQTLGPNGQPLAHPSFPHPSSCQKFVTCYFSKDIKELGCMSGQVPI